MVECLVCQALDLESPAAKVGGFRNPWKGRGVAVALELPFWTPKGTGCFFVDFYI